MKMYKMFFKLLIILFLSINLFAAKKSKDIDKINEIVKNEKKDVAYLGLQKEAPKQYRITGNFKKDNKYNKKKYSFNKIFISGQEQTFENTTDNDLDKKGIFGIENDLNKVKTVVYNITGSENKFNLSDSEKRNIYDLDDREISSFSKKLILTKYQKAQIDYLEMERKYKILAIEKEITLRKKMLEEELSKDNYNVFLVEKLSSEIKILAIDRETVDINVDKKIRYVLDFDQYLKYKEKQKKKK